MWRDIVASPSIAVTLRIAMPIESNTPSAAQGPRFIDTPAKSPSGESIKEDPPSTSEQSTGEPSGATVSLSLQHRISSSSSFVDTVTIQAHVTKKLEQQEQEKLGKLEKPDLQPTELSSSTPVKTPVPPPPAPHRQSKRIGGFFSSVASALGGFASRVRNGIARLFLRQQVRTLENQSKRAEQRLQKLERSVSPPKPKPTSAKPTSALLTSGLSLGANREDFLKVLENPELRAKFAKFAEREYSGENLAFITACGDFRKLGASEKREGALWIRNQFIVTNAPRQVNLPYGQDRALMEIFEAYKREATEFNGVPIDQAMDAAMKTVERGITDLMVSDTFLRFLSAPDRDF
jgi:hypothetical protein